MSKNRKFPPLLVLTLFVLVVTILGLLNLVLGSESLTFGDVTIAIVSIILFGVIFYLSNRVPGANG